MTYNDIYKNFLIEYDKADVSSSYPSLTNEEIAAILNKAMYALIAQKVTGNNPRKVALDMDSKAMADIAPLIDVYLLKTTLTSTTASDDTTKGALAKNELIYKYQGNTTPPEYVLSGIIEYTNGEHQTVQLLTSVIADKFKQTIHNKPWIKEPVMYLQSPSTTINKTTCIHVLVDPDKITDLSEKLYIRGIKMPRAFNGSSDDNTFPLSDTVCEELINLAVIFACRNVQDPRLATVVQTKSLEA